MTKITLCRKIKMCCNTIIADIWIASKTRYYMPSLMHVNEQNKKATIRSLANSLFAESLPMSNAVMDFLITSKLVQKINQQQQNIQGLFETSSVEYDQRHQITCIGEQSIEDKKIFVKQHGLWKIYYTTDPLIPSVNQILRISEEDKDLIEFSDKKLKKDQPKPDVIDSKIKSLQKKYFKPVLGDSLDDFRIDTIEKYTKSWKPDLDDSISWTVSSNGINTLIVTSLDTLTLNSSSRNSHSNKEQTTKAVLSPPSIEYDKLWKKLLREFGISHDWDFNNEHLSRYYDDTDLGERVSMKKILKGSPTIGKYGTFDEISVTVDIYPKHKSDMERWIIDIIYEQIVDYFTQEKYEEIKKDVKKKIPDVKKFPSKQELLDKFDSHQKPKFWYVHAMEDWDIE